MVAVGVDLVVSIIACIISIIAAASYLNMFNGNSRVHAGHHPDSYWNIGYYADFSLLAFGLVHIFLAVAELGLLFKPEWFSFVDSPILRGAIYAISGIACLGTSGDLGIAAGSLLMILGVFMIVYYGIVKGGKCKGGK